MQRSERRAQILASAAALIVARANSSCTLDEIAEAAGISKPLIFKYFSSREDLLKALMQVEYQRLRERGLDAIKPDAPLETVVTEIFENVLGYYFERGAILALLWGDPAVAGLARQRANQQQETTLEYFLKRSIETYNVPPDVARIGVTMVMNAPILATRPLYRRGFGAKRVAEVWSTFVNGGWKALAEKFGER
jgi:AcrR family transcriptional regulator